MVRADPPPPQLWSKTINLHFFFWTLPLRSSYKNNSSSTSFSSSSPSYSFYSSYSSSSSSFSSFSFPTPLPPPRNLLDPTHLHVVSAFHGLQVLPCSSSPWSVVPLSDSRTFDCNGRSGGEKEVRRGKKEEGRGIVGEREGGRVELFAT